MAEIESKDGCERSEEHHWVSGSDRRRGGDQSPYCRRNPGSADE